MRSSRKTETQKKRKAEGGRLEPAGEWAEHSALQRQENHVPHYRGCLETQTALKSLCKLVMVIGLIYGLDSKFHGG